MTGGGGSSGGDDLERRAAAVFDRLLDVPAADRPAAAAAACGSDAALLARVRSLLDALQLADGFLTTPPTGDAGATSGIPAAPPSPTSVGERAGDQIGPYKLLEQIGEGGFGVVFLAQQDRPVRRRVAVKVLKVGMDTREVVARFEAERQALAMMDHPHIAKVFDAGSTASGRPYFVMEYVRGLPITDHADRHRLGTRARVALAADVCRAVQHAHAKGVIHRDLKPTNVLVTTTTDDDRPVPKVIDFGIAKATQAKLTDRTLFTGLRQLIGTPQYMSPEQADGDGVDVDTRSDVYSLGVLTYELLVGTTPIDARALRSAASEAMRRMIRETDPARPSTKLSSLGASLAAVASNRGTDARQLGRQLHGELDWIVMRALEKDRRRRYDTAAALADDLGRYLAGEAVVAGPVSAWYRARKVAGRHRAGLAVAAVAAVLVAAGLLGTTAGLVRARTARADQRAFAYRSAVNAAAVALRAGNGPRFAHELAAAPPDHRGWEWDLLDRAGTRRDARRLTGAPGELFDPLCSPSDTVAVAVSTTGQVVAWNLETGQVAWREPGTAAQTTAAGGGSVVIVRADGTLDVCDLTTRHRRWTAGRSPPGHRWWLDANAFSVDGSLLATGFVGLPGVTVYDVATGRATHLETRDPAGPGFLAEPPDSRPHDRRGRLYANGQRSNNLTVDLADPPVTAPMVLCPNPHRAADRIYVPGSPLDAAASTLGSNGMLLPRHGVYAAYIQSAGGIVAMPVPAERAAGGAKSSPPLPFPTRPVVVSDRSVLIAWATPDESRFVLRLDDGSVWVVPVDPPATVVMPSELNGLYPSPDGSRVATLEWGAVGCFEPVSGLPLWRRNVGEEFGHNAAWSPDGSRLVVTLGAEAGQKAADVFVLDGRTGAVLDRWSRSPVPGPIDRPRGPAPWAGIVSGLAFTADGRWLRVAHPDGSLSRVDPTTWAVVATQPPTPRDFAAGGPVLPNNLISSQLLAGPAGQYAAQLTLAGSTADPLSTALVVRDGGGDHAVSTVRLADHVAVSAHWFPNGKQLAVGFARPDDGQVAVVDPATGRPRWVSPTPDGSTPWFVLVTPDASRVVALTGTALLVVYDAADGAELLASPQAAAAAAAAILPDGALLVGTGGPPEGVRRWDVADPESSLTAVRSVWPVNPRALLSVADARRQVAAAWPAVLADRYFPAEVPADSPLASALARTVEPSAVWVVSTAAAINAGGPASADRRPAAEAALARTAAASPWSFSVQCTLGQMRFDDGKLAESFAPLSAAVDLLPAYGQPRSAELELTRAVAARAANDRSADALYDRATDLARRAGPGRQAELTDLRERARQAFGR